MRMSTVYESEFRYFKHRNTGRYAQLPINANDLIWEMVSADEFNRHQDKINPGLRYTGISSSDMAVEDRELERELWGLEVVVQQDNWMEFSVKTPREEKQEIENSPTVPPVAWRTDNQKAEWARNNPNPFSNYRTWKHLGGGE